MLMSKQHYAIALANQGNIVYFISHPDLNRLLRRGEINIEQTSYRNISVVKSRLIHPYFLKFKCKWLYNFLTGIHINRILNKIGKEPDVVWLFDIGNSIPLKYFPKRARKIYMPVDGPYGTKEEEEGAIGADIIISVTNEIIAQFNKSSIPSFCINHGVADIFINLPKKFVPNSKIRIGYSGSILRNDIDTEVFLKIIRLHPNAIFEIWGEYDYLKSNIHNPDDVPDKTINFIKELETQTNVILHGAVSSVELANGLKRMDCFILIYDSRGFYNTMSNSHKMLEYLASGKAIVSSYISYYESYPNLITMVKDKNSNDEFPNLFSEVINNIAFYNSVSKQKEKIDFAKHFTYQRQVDKIEKILTEFS